jgi:hypothetical protein
MRGFKGSCHTRPKLGQKFRPNDQNSGGLYRLCCMIFAPTAFYSGERNSSPL